MEEGCIKVLEKDEIMKGSEMEVGFWEEIVVIVYVFSFIYLLFCDVLWWYIMYDLYVWDIKLYVWGIVL